MVRVAARTRRLLRVLQVLKVRRKNVNRRLQKRFIAKANMENREARVMELVHSCSDQFALGSLPEKLTSFVLLIYCGRLMRDASESRACIASSGGTLEQSEVQRLVASYEQGGAPAESAINMIAKIVATPYFLTEDVERMSLVVQLAKKEKLDGLCEELLRAYGGVLYKRRKEYDKPQSLDCAIPDPTGLLKLGTFVQKLVFERRPNSLLPHLDAAAECITHALLLLKHSELKVTYPIDITYAQLWEIPDREAEKALAIFYNSRYSSYWDMSMRCDSVLCHDKGEEGTVVEHATSEDIPEDVRELLHPGELQLIDMRKYPVLSRPELMYYSKRAKGHAAAFAMREILREREYLSEPLEYHKLYSSVDVPQCEIGDGDFC